MLFNYKAESMPQSPPLWGSHSAGHGAPALITPGPVHNQAQPCAQSLLKWSKRANSKPAHPASPVPSHENHTTGLSPWFPLLPLAAEQPWCFPVWHVPSSWELPVIS